MVNQRGQLNELFRACFTDPTDEALSALDRKLRSVVLASLAATFDGDADLIHDAYQEAFTRLLMLCEENREPDNPVGYFIAMARNAYIDEWRKRSRETTLDAVAIDLLVVGDDDRRAEMLSVLLVLDRMEPRCRYVLSAMYFRGTPHAVIAVQLGVQEQSVRMVAKRCRDRLRELLRE